MNRVLPTFLLLAASGLAAPAPYSASGGSATFDHRVTVVNVHGEITGVNAAVNLDPDDLASTTGRVSVPLNDLKTGNSLRDDHARGPRALNTAQFPEATFTLDKLTGGRLVEGQTLATTATGRLTVKGVTKAATVPVKATLQGGQVAVQTQFKFNPRDFGVNYPGSSDSVSVGVRFLLKR